tara:strand:- start:2396 stop:2953 length:558 start_codon:yes stop_codon:yes gene_type:complete
MGKHKVAFLDRDGVINFDYGHIGNIKRFDFIPDSLKGMRSLMNLGYKIIIITNQSGIARGLYSEDDFHNLMNQVIKRLRKHSIEILKYYYCPHHPDSNIPKYKKKCFFRKPQPGMILKAMDDFEIDLDSSFLAGDNITDIISGERAGLKNLCLIDNKNDIIRNSKTKNFLCYQNLNKFVEETLNK